jgi:RimJ/RimL family protein N-acetyltransferase
MDPKLLEIPKSIETARLTLRAPRPGDGPAVNEAIRESAAELQPWMPWAEPLPTVEQTESHTRASMAKFLTREDLHYRFYLKGSETFVGSASLVRIVWDVPKFEIGYWVRTRFAGRGYVTEAAGCLMRLAFETLGARRVEIRCDGRNVRSARIAERLGFALEGVLKNECRDHRGGLRDTRIYARTGPA